MRLQNIGKIGALCGALMALTGCGGVLGSIGGNNPAVESEADRIIRDYRENELGISERDSTIFDLFQNANPPDTTIEVNKYIWTAAQQILDFMPIQAADPFSGVLVYGYGTPPGGRVAYRATVFVQDPALDARSLNLSLATRRGPATADTVRAIEDAILTRARQLRIRDSAL